MGPMTQIAGISALGSLRGSSLRTCCSDKRCGSSRTGSAGVWLIGFPSGTRAEPFPRGTNSGYFQRLRGSAHARRTGRHQAVARVGRRDCGSTDLPRAPGKPYPGE
jgi:hypothetical protein